MAVLDLEFIYLFILFFFHRWICRAGRKDRRTAFRLLACHLFVLFFFFLSFLRIVRATLLLSYQNTDFNFEFDERERHVAAKNRINFDEILGSARVQQTYLLLLYLFSSSYSKYVSLCLPLSHDLTRSPRLLLYCSILADRSKLTIVKKKVENFDIRAVNVLNHGHHVRHISTYISLSLSLLRSFCTIIQ